MCLLNSGATNQEVISDQKISRKKEQIFFNLGFCFREKRV